MRKYSIIIITVIIALIQSCSKESGPDNFEPLITTGEASDINYWEATLNGTVDQRGSTAMPRLFFTYSGEDNKEMQADAVTDGRNVSASVNGLRPGTQYRFRLSGDNGRVSIHGLYSTFTTLPLDKPVISPLTTLSHGPTSVIIGFTITSDGGEEITEAGCHVTEADGKVCPTVTVVHPEYAVGGMLKMTISNLKQHTTYLLQPYATNRFGTTTAEQMAFTTTDAVSLMQPGDLEQLMGDGALDFTKMSFAGPMDGNDIQFLRRMAGRNPDGTRTDGKLTHIDMTDVMIVTGGESYDLSHFTTDNIVSTGMFSGCDNIISLSLPHTATVIEKNALEGCTSLRSITIPASATSVTPSDGLTALMEINVMEGHDNYRSIDGVMLNGQGTQIIWFPQGKQGHYTVPESISEIGDNAFSGSALTSIALPRGLTKMGSAVFYGCGSLEEITMPEELKLIPAGTFQNSPKLHVIHLGGKVEYLSEYIFDGCPLTDLYINATLAPVCTDNAFSSTDGYDIPRNCTLHVPYGRKATYTYHRVWGKFERIVEEKNLE